MKKNIVITDFACDNCGIVYHNYKRLEDIAITSEMIKNGWNIVEDKCFCPACKNSKIDKEIIFHLPGAYRIADCPLSITNSGNKKPIGYVVYDKMKFDGKLTICITNDFKDKCADFMHMCVTWDKSLSLWQRTSKRIVYNEYDNDKKTKSIEFINCICHELYDNGTFTNFHFTYQYFNYISTDIENESLKPLE